MKIWAGKDMPKNNKNGEFPIFGNGIGSASILGYSKKWIAPKKSITISARGTIGHVIFHDKEFTPIVRLITLIVNFKKALPKYLFYKLKTMKFNSTGAVQKQLTIPMIKEVLVDITNLEHQQKIIDIIEPIDNAIFKLKKISVYLFRAISLYVQKFDKNSYLKDFATIKKFSKLINSSLLSSKDKYLYSTGKIVNQRKRTNKMNFKKGLSIPYEGAGILTSNGRLFLSMHIEPLYIARKYGISTMYPITIYYSIHNVVDGSFAKVMGLKMPKLTIEHISNVLIPKPTMKIEKDLSLIHSKIYNVKNLIFNLNQLKIKILKLKFN